MNANVKRIVACPTCKKSVSFEASNPWRPFCSERCKTIDIADWAEENFRIPGPTLSFDEFQETESRRPDDED
ncbi:MAG: DNA gyrase inhibitor YacG [Oligoflexus sp.]